MCDAAFIPRIARLLARFHRTRVPVKKGGVPFSTIRHWLEMARSLEFPPGTPKAAAYSRLDFAAIERSVGAVEAACARARSPVVFSHCDLLSGNILILQKEGFDAESPDLDGRLTVIDFEYGAYAPRGFDFGNHFNEYAGFECDYTR
jgi:ethanolamine kinase